MFYLARNLIYANVPQFIKEIVVENINKITVDVENTVEPVQSVEADIETRENITEEPEETIKAPEDISIRDLLDAKLHFGHQTRRWNPKMKPYIFGKHNGIYIIDLTKTFSMLSEALQYIYDVVASG